MRILAIILSFLFCTDAISSTYFVRTDGLDSHTGTANTSADAWLTIGKAASTITSDDIVYIQPGTYNERVTMNGKNGSSGHSYTFVGVGMPVCRGFELTDCSYIRIIGLTITHINTTYNRGIVLFGTCSHIDIIDNTFSFINGNGIGCASTPVPSFLTVRGNTFYYMGAVEGVQSNGNATAISTAFVTTHDVLFEYNSATRCGDYVSCYGTNVIVRNNYLADFHNDYFPGGGGDGLHVDFFQPGSGGVQAGSRNQIYERNFMGDNIELNSHCLLWRDTISAGDTNIIFRGNVTYNLGSGCIFAGGVDHFCSYNNVFYDVTKVSGDGNPISFITEVADGALNGMAANTILDTTPLPRTKEQFYIEAGSDALFTHNIGYLTGASTSFVSTSDPLFIDAVNRNFRLQAGSPAINAGTNVIWITSDAGSGTSFTVNDSQLLCDGWGMVDGDMVTTGGTTTRITSIDWATETITVADSVTWTNLQPVYWGTDTGVTIGALPYGSTALTAATISQSGTTYTVTPTGDCRGVWFYVDGIPTTWVSTAPYSATIASGTVTAKAYALYAQATPVVNATTGSPPTSARWLPFLIGKKP